MPDCSDRAPLQLLDKTRVVLLFFVVLLSAPPACDVFRLWCSASLNSKIGMSGNVPVYAYASPKSMLPQSCTCASQKSRTLPQSHFHAQLKLACTYPPVGVSAMAARQSCDEARSWGSDADRAGSRVGDGQPPPPSESMTAGVANREFVALTCILGKRTARTDLYLTSAQFKDDA